MRAVVGPTEGAEGDGSRRARPPGTTTEAATNTSPDTAGSPRQSLTARRVLRLQRSAGNRAVARLVGKARGRGPGNGASPAVQRTSGSAGTSARAGGQGAGTTAGPAPGVDTATTAGTAGTATADAAGAALVAPGLAVQRRADPGSGPIAPPVPPKPAKPQQDPNFTKVTKDVAGTAKTLRAHPAAPGEAKKASDAAQAPPGDKEAQAKAAQAGKMSGAKPGGFDKAAFIAAVKKAVAAKAPKNLEEADEFSDSGKAEDIKSEVQGQVSEGKKSSAKDIAETTGEKPDQSKAKDKKVVPMQDEPAPKPGAPDTSAAMPDKAPPEQTDLRAGKADTDAQMAEADVTEDQLANSNEPEFKDALKSKKEGEKHSEEAPGPVREAEAQTLQDAEQDAGQKGQQAVASMTQKRSGVQSQVGDDKGQAKSKDEGERQRITSEIQKIFDATKTDVDKILNDLDGSVDKKFSSGEASARAAFEADQKSRMDAYKDKRYSGITGKARWVKDKLTRMPKEADNLFLESKKIYESKMDGVISDVADHIGKELTRAKDRIAKGRADIDKYVASQPKELQKVAKDAAGKIGSQFDQLESDVDSKQDQLVDDIATKYVEAKEAVDARIEELQAANKGLWEKAKDAIGGAIQTIIKLKDMLMGVLARAAGVIGKIIKDPIGFLGNLIKAVKGGVTRFADNIVSHLKKGMQGWLFGTLSSAGIEIPDSLDLKGIIKLVLSVLGLTWTAIRTKIVKRIGEKAMSAVEKGVDIFKTLVTEGVGGLWKFLIDKLGDLKDMVMDAIQDFVVVKVIKAGITWLIAALNPAAAFIKACKMIYDAVMFFVERGSQIKEFVDSVLDSVGSIASGAIGKVTGLIENTLSKILPLLISFLASLLGLGGISDKIKDILEKVQKPVSKAIDFVINGALKLARPIINKLKKGAAWVKGKYEKGKAKVKGAASKVAEKLGIVKRPVSAAGESHTLSANTRTGVIRMASVEESIPAKVAKWVSTAKRRGIPDADAQGQRILAEATQASDRIKQAQTGRSDVARQVLDRLAEVIPGLMVRIGATDAVDQTHPASENPRGIRPGLGDVAPYSRQTPKDTPVPEGYQLHPGEDEYRALVREHVIPVAFVSALFEAIVVSLGDNDITSAVREAIARPSAEERQLHVVFIYKTAADAKTEGKTSADNQVIGQIARLAKEGTPKNIRGSSVWAKARRASLRVRFGRGKAYRDALTQLQQSANAAAAERRSGLWSKMAGVLNGRVHRTPRLVVNDHDGTKIPARGHDAPLPTEDRIRNAAEQETKDIIEIVITRLNNVDPPTAGTSE
jgi:hypothetical protein